MSDTLLYAQAQQAIAQKDLASARRHLCAMENPPAFLLAQVCAHLGDVAGEEAALQQLLAQEPRHLQALLAMGNIKARAGDDRAATSFFRTALNQARVTQQVPANLNGPLERAARHIEASNARFEAHLLANLGDAGHLPRVAEAVDLLTGKTQLYLQQPSMFYLPGLPQRAFYERCEFDWLAEIEAATGDLQAELQSHLETHTSFAPYVEAPKDRPAPNNPLKGDDSWGAHYFIRNGAIIAEHAAAAPATMAALAKAPIPQIRGRSPMALWSVLKPGTHIQPHHGLLNTRLICHIPLIANPDCALRVGAHTRQWEIGKALVFDDSIEHEAWNRGNATRIILLFEIWRPEISPDERTALTHLFETIDQLQPASEMDTL